MTVRRSLMLPVGALLFTVLATANSGGYRYGIADQSFYQPAVALTLNPSLFPRDRVVLASQMRLWVGDSVLAWLGRLVGNDLPALFAIVYVAGLLALFAAAIALARSLGAGWWTTAAFLILLTLRHRIPKTGANSLEGYMHPRILAFAIGLIAFSAIARGRFAVGLVWVAAAALVHTTVGLWFGAALLIGWAWRLERRHAALLIGIAIATAAGLAMTTPLGDRLAIMGPEWIGVLGDKDYLFPADWPPYAWALNLLYPVVVLSIHRRRRALGRVGPGEEALVAGLVGLVLLFLASVPLTAVPVALAVQLQVNRVFWLLDAVTACYVAWWLMEDVAGRAPPVFRRVVILVLLLVSAVRGYYLVGLDDGRRLVEAGLPATPWVDAMTWLGTQPVSWHVFADPYHAVLFGPSVRVAAARDTLLEINKDAALAMYDPRVAARLAERERAVGDFARLTIERLGALAQQFDLDVFVDRVNRRFDLPVLYRNDEFVIYDLR